MSDIVVYLPLEIYAREYLGKLALAAFLVQNNVSVVIGYNQQVRQFALDASRPGVYYEIKGKTPTGMDYLDELKNNGFKLVAQDEESGISYKEWNEFFNWRQEASGANFFDLYFTWGHQDYEGYSKNAFNENLVNTGSPRATFWGNPGKVFYANEVASIVDSVGDYILIVTGFATKNSLLSKREVKKLYTNLGYSNNSWEARKNRFEWQTKAENFTYELIDKLLESTSENIVIRPHPAEDDSDWRNRFRDNERVIVSKKGESLPFVLGASAIFHSGSTVAFEGVLCGVPTFTYSSLVGEGGVQMFADDISIRLMDLESIGGILADPLLKNISNPHDLKLNQRILGYGTAHSLLQQSQLIFSLMSELPTGRSSITPTTEAYRNILTDTMSRVINLLKYGKSSYLNQHKHKRPSITTNRVLNDLNKLSRIFELRKNFKVEEISESTFRISSQTRDLIF